MSFRRRTERGVRDGEIVCLKRKGNSQFKKLLFRRDEQRFYAFDLLGLVTVIPRAAERLDNYRVHLGKPNSGPMFPGHAKRKPLSHNNVLNLEIKPVLNRCVQGGKPKAEHIKAEVDYKYQRDERLPEWRGWHAFSRVTRNQSARPGRR